MRSPVGDRIHRFEYQRQDSAQTLAAGLNEYYRGHPCVIRPDAISPESAALFRRHDICHVIFGLDTTIVDEAMADLRTMLSTDVGVRRYVQYLRTSKEHRISSRRWAIRAHSPPRCAPSRASCTHWRRRCARESAGRGIHPSGTSVNRSRRYGPTTGFACCSSERAEERHQVVHLLTGEADVEARVCGARAVRLLERARRRAIGAVDGREERISRRERPGVLAILPCFRGRCPEGGPSWRVASGNPDSRAIPLPDARDQRVTDTRAKAAPCGSTACTIQLPPGTSLGPISTWPPLALIRSMAASMPSTFT